MSSVQPGLTYSDAGRCMVRQRIGRCYCAWIAVVSRLGNFRKEKEAGLYQLLGSIKKRTSGDGIG